MNIDNYNLSFFYHFYNTSDFKFENYYDFSEFYEVETIRAWEEKFENLKVLNKLFIVISIFIAVIDLILLLSILSARVRKESASWYLYHLNFVTILQVCFSLPRLEASLHESFGTCMFFSFTEWLFVLTYYANIVLMDIEILANIFASDALWKTNPEKRFYISMSVTWTSSILFSAVIMFFGHDQHPEFPICFNLNSAAEKVGQVMKNLLPFIFSTSFMIAGLTLFIRSKRSPDSFKHVTRDKLQAFNEWFVCFFTWNSFIAFLQLLTSFMHAHAISMDFLLEIGFQMANFIIHVGLPLSCLFLEPVRTTYEEWAIAVYRSITKKKPSCSSDSDYHQLLRVEATE